MKCPRCGTDNVQGRATCYLCHTPLQSTPATHAANYGAQPATGGYQSSHGSSGSMTGDGGQMQVSASHNENYPMSQQGASMDSGFGVGLGQVMSYPPKEREVGYPNSGPSWMAPPQGQGGAVIGRNQPEATEQIPIPANGASQNTAPYETPNFAEQLHQHHQGTQPAPTAEQQAPDWSNQTASSQDDAATEEMQAGLISADPQEAAARLSAGKTSPSQPAMSATSSLPSNAVTQHPTGAAMSQHKPLPRPRLERDFVFAPKVELPSLFRRLFAGGIDLLIVAALALLVAAMFGPKSTHPFPHGLHGIDLLATVLQRYTPQFNFFVIAFAVTLFSYSTVLLALGGQTVGKMVMRLKVIDRSGKPFSITGSLARSLALLVSFFAGLIGLTWILFDKEYRGLHDRLSGALVIRTPPS